MTLINSFIGTLLFLVIQINALQVHALSAKNINSNIKSNVNDQAYSRRIPQEERRKFITKIASFATTTFSPLLIDTLPSSATTTNSNDNSNNVRIFTDGYGREEYTNSITASRDTNISPKEVYDSIQSSYIYYPIEQLKKRNDTRTPRALDVGAGAGVSTNTLYLMGYTNIEAVDWSSKAWDDNVNEDLVPKGVNFYALDDESYIKDRIQQNGYVGLFDVIVFNFAVNDSKAKAYAMTLLQPDGRLLAPVNTQTDYWLKQQFKVYDYQGNVLWSARDVGAWSVQFQPDVTQDTCQGIWCAPYNGFKKKR